LQARGQLVDVNAKLENPSVQVLFWPPIFVGGFPHSHGPGNDIGGSEID
jgi:hypothetical protein